MGAAVFGRWHSWHFSCRIAATFLAKVGAGRDTSAACAGPGCMARTAKIPAQKASLMVCSSCRPGGLPLLKSLDSPVAPVNPDRAVGQFLVDLGQTTP